jgi:hypothetical protein
MSEINIYQLLKPHAHRVQRNDTTLRMSSGFCLNLSDWTMNTHYDWHELKSCCNLAQTTMQETNSCVLARKGTALSPTAFLIPCSTEMPRIPLYHGKLNHQKLRTWVHVIYEPTGQTITNRILIRNGNASKKLVKLKGLRCESARQEQRLGVRCTWHIYSKRLQKTQDQSYKHITICTVTFAYIETDWTTSTS